MCNLAWAEFRVFYNTIDLREANYEHHTDITLGRKVRVAIVVATGSSEYSCYAPRT